MIQFNNQLVSTNQHPRHARLQRKYRALCQSIDPQGDTYLPMTATFIPSAGIGIAFDRPVERVNSVLMCTFGNDLAEPGPYPFYRGWRPRYQHATGKVFWEVEDWFNFRISSNDFASEADERLMRGPRLLDTLIGLHDLASRAAKQPRLLGCFGTPPAMLGFQPDEADLYERLASKPTAIVQAYAEQHSVSCEQAWRALHAESCLPDDVDVTGLRLINARLCCDEQTGTTHLPKVMMPYLDLRPLLGRRYTNPSRKLDGMLAANPAEQIIWDTNRQRDHAMDPGQWTQAEADDAVARMRQRIGPRSIFFDEHDLSEALCAPDQPVRVNNLDRGRVLRAYSDEAVANGMRALLIPSIAAGCTDEDLVNAFNRPERPLIASRIAQRFCW